MATASQVKGMPAEVQKKVDKARALFADAPQMAKTALENALRELSKPGGSASQATKRTESAGRIGYRQGNVSELTVIAPFSKGGAERLRAVLDLTSGNFEGAELVGTVHDMRFVFLEIGRAHV